MQTCVSCDCRMNQYKRGPGASIELDLTEMSEGHHQRSPTVPAAPHLIAPVPHTNQPQKKRLLSIHPKVLAPQFIPGEKASRPFLPMTNLFDVSFRGFSVLRYTKGCQAYSRVIDFQRT